MPVVRVEPVLPAKPPDLVDGIGRGLAKPDGLLGATDLLHREIFGPPAEHEAAIPPARAAAADVLLQDHHLERGITLFQPDRRPKAGIAAAHDADIGLVLALEPGRGLPLLGQNLLEPVTSEHLPVLIWFGDLRAARRVGACIQQRRGSPGKPSRPCPAIVTRRPRGLNA